MSWPVMVPARVGGVAGCVFLWVEHHHVGVAHCWVLGKQAGLVAVWLLWVVPGGLAGDGLVVFLVLLLLVGLLCGFVSGGGRCVV